jgi:hypothetical protein
MRARIPVTLGLSCCGSLALSFTVGSGAVTIGAVCAILAGALAFGGWVLSTDDRTERLERLIRAVRGRTRSRRPAKPGPKESARPGPKE